MIDHPTLRSLLAYDPVTGVFRWRQGRSCGVKAGQETGRVDTRGYLQVCVGGKRYLAHRLAWYYEYGVWPDGEIDHIDGNRLRNAIENLRDVPREGNARNKARYSSTNAGLPTGVSRKGRGWQVRLGSEYGGYYHDLEQAVSVRHRLAAEMGYSARHGVVI